MTQVKLLDYYQGNYEKVLAAFKNVDGDKEYIEFAKKQLEAVRKGGIEELKKFWKTFNLNQEEDS